jgi:putative ABC transport system substrate-binding protein
VTAFRQGLKEVGFVEGQNVAVEYRWADNQFDRLPALVADLLHRPVVVIVGNFNSALAAKAATTTVPIVFTTGGDPISDGLVSSLNRPGGNVTGINFLGGVLGAKRLDLLRQIAPKTATIGVLVNPNRADTEAERRDVQAAAQAIGQQLIILDVRSDRDSLISHSGSSAFRLSTTTVSMSLTGSWGKTRNLSLEPSETQTAPHFAVAKLVSAPTKMLL